MRAQLHGKATNIRRAIGAVSASLLILGAGVSTTSAAGPAWEEVSVDDTFYLPLTSAACGFDVYEHDEGVLTFQIIETAGGMLRFKDLAVRVSVTLVAPSQGTSVELQAGGRGGQMFLLRPDGSALALTPGTNGHVTVPGEGVIYMWAGSVRATIAPDGTVTEHEHGFIMDTYSSLCGLLAA